MERGLGVDMMLPLLCKAILINLCEIRFHDKLIKFNRCNQLPKTKMPPPSPSPFPSTPSQSLILAPCVVPLGPPPPDLIPREATTLSDVTVKALRLLPYR